MSVKLLEVSNKSPFNPDALLLKTHHFAADISESSEELPVIPIISADRPFISGTDQSKHSILQQRERRGKEWLLKRKAFHPVAN